MPQCIIIDPCLFSFGGHEYVMDQFLVREAHKRGYQALVLANKAFQEKAEFPCKSVFLYSPYASAGRSEQEDWSTFDLGNKEMYRVLKHNLPPENLEPNSLILVHTACSTILAGLAAWLRKSNRPDLKIRLILRWGANRRQSSLNIGVKLFRKVFNMWSQISGDVRFFVDSGPLLTHFQGIYPQNYGVTPIGVDFSSAPEIPPFVSKDHLTFAFAGTPYKSKGGHLLSPAIRKHIQRFPEDRFVIHVCGMGEEGEEEFFDLPTEQVRLVRPYLQGRDYINHILGADVMLIPYSTKEYHLRTSHIFIESLGLGRAVICSAHPWMKQVLSEQPKPSGLLMNQWSVMGLRKAMEKMRENVDVYRQNAYEQSRAIREYHNPSNWFEVVCQ